MSIHVIRQKTLDRKTVDNFPKTSRVVAEIHVTYPAGTSLALVRQQLDRAYLDALDDIASEEVA